MSVNPLILLVPEAGVEPAQAQGPGDFESPAYTSFTTPAQGFFLIHLYFYSPGKSRWQKTDPTTEHTLKAKDDLPSGSESVGGRGKSIGSGIDRRGNL